MLRSETTFPTAFDNILCAFMKKAWENGWLDDYSDDHFLIMALENRLDQFTWNEQFLNNNNNSYYSPITKNGTIDYEAFGMNFCINLSAKLTGMAYMFGEDKTRRFVVDQLSAGKRNYNEDAFFQAFSEIEILTFIHRGFDWKDIKYEPSIGPHGANPEACFVGIFHNNYSEPPVEVKVNIEVKTPQFPRLSTHKEKFLIPTILLSNQGRQTIPDVCKAYNFEFVSPRVNKLVEFLNSATRKFDYPQKNEYNLLYINWAYCDFPSNAFLEAWSLLTNPYNGLLTHPEIATKLPLKEPISEEAYKKITAVIVYTSSIDQLMFCDFKHVWQRTPAGCKFRMFVLDEHLRSSELTNASNLLFQLTNMNPDHPDYLAALLAGVPHTPKEINAHMKFSDYVSKLIIENALT